MTELIAGDCLRLRRAEPTDAAFLLELMEHDQVEPFVAVVRPRDEAGVLTEIERSLAEPEDFGRFVIEVPKEGWNRAGALGWEIWNRRNRIARLGGLAVHPDHRGHGLADAAARAVRRHLLGELGLHRLELECYAFNERAIRHAERAGFVREGVKRKAYWRHGRWVDGILFGLVREDLGEEF